MILRGLLHEHSWECWRFPYIGFFSKYFLTGSHLRAFCMDCFQRCIFCFLSEGGVDLPVIFGGCELVDMFAVL